MLTSGEDRIFPKGFPIGTVESAKAGNPFQVIHVQPARASTGWKKFWSC